MATVVVTFGALFNAGGSTAISKTGRATEQITSALTVVDGATTAKSGEFAKVLVLGGPVLVHACKPGADTVDTQGWAMADGTSEVFGPLADGDIISVIDIVEA